MVHFSVFIFVIVSTENMGLAKETQGEPKLGSKFLQNEF
jgi:hypothetical protein